jgi:MtaA/CmuA family methyltransferase
MTGKERMMATLLGGKPDRIPVFPLLMHFAADRYGVAYREFAANGHVMAEAQLNMFERFDLDAITVSTDAFRVSGDLGGELIFPENKPPYLSHPIVTSDSDLARLKRPDVTDAKCRMNDRIKGAAELVRSAGDECMIVGWVEMPFAEACAVCGISNFMMMLYDDPGLAHKILTFLTDVNIEFAIAQIEEGVPMIGAGDAAASLISPELYRKFALPYEQRVARAIHEAGGLVKLHICGDTNKLLSDMATSGADMFNVDHMVDFGNAVEVYGNADLAFKGNIDPVADMLFATPDECGAKIKKCVQEAEGKKYAISAGCEVPAAVTDDVFIAFCDSAKSSYAL